MGTHFCVTYFICIWYCDSLTLIFEDAEMCRSNISRKDSPMESGQCVLQNAGQRHSDEVFR